MESFHCRPERFLKDLSVQLFLLSVEESETQESYKQCQLVGKGWGWNQGPWLLRYGAFSMAACVCGEGCLQPTSGGDGARRG